MKTGADTDEKGARCHRGDEIVVSSAEPLLTDMARVNK
eukprot:COSAG05_NODE_17144_length_331_cov_0.659483_1_plen_37_part_10